MREYTQNVNHSTSLMSSKSVTLNCTPGLENCASLKRPRLDDDARNKTLEGEGERGEGGVGDKTRERAKGWQAPRLASQVLTQPR